MASYLDYFEIEALLSSRNAIIRAAEAHGTLSGMLCVDIQAGADQWLMEVFDHEIDSLVKEDRITLLAFFDQTRRWLGGADYEFDLVMPDDEVPLEERACALSEWSRGFLFGLGYSGDQSQWSGDCNEILRDISEISRLDPEAEGEENEQAYMELTEYIRAGVQIIRSELQRASGQPSSSH